MVAGTGRPVATAVDELGQSCLPIYLCACAKKNVGARAGVVAAKSPVAYLLAMTAAQNREQSTPPVASAHDKILIVDFGSQVTQLIARRVREDGVYCEIVPFNKAEEAFKEMKP